MADGHLLELLLGEQAVPEKVILVSIQRCLDFPNGSTKLLLRIMSLLLQNQLHRIHILMIVDCGQMKLAQQK